MDKSILSEVIKNKTIINDDSFKSFLYGKEDISEVFIIRTGKFVADMFKLIKDNYMDMANVFINEYEGIGEFTNWVEKLQDKFKIRNHKNDSDVEELYTEIKKILPVNEGTDSHDFNTLFSSQDLSGLLDVENMAEILSIYMDETPNHSKFNADINAYTTKYKNGPRFLDIAIRKMVKRLSTVIPEFIRKYYASDYDKIIDEVLKNKQNIADEIVDNSVIRGE